VSYTVVVPLVIWKDQDGRPHHVYEGGRIQWLSDEQARHFLDTGLVVADGETSPDGEDDKPTAGAKKADLVDWLVANAAKEDGSDYTADELESLKVAELRDLVDSVE
jgi:hypothetical protein